MRPIPDRWIDEGPVIEPAIVNVMQHAVMIAKCSIHQMVLVLLLRLLME